MKRIPINLTGKCSSGECPSGDGPSGECSPGKRPTGEYPPGKRPPGLIPYIPETSDHIIPFRHQHEAFNKLSEANLGTYMMFPAYRILGYLYSTEMDDHMPILAVANNVNCMSRFLYIYIGYFGSPFIRISCALRDYSGVFEMVKNEDGLTMYVNSLPPGHFHFYHSLRTELYLEDIKRSPHFELIGISSVRIIPYDVMEFKLYEDEYLSPRYHLTTN